MNLPHYIGLMSGTSADGIDAVLVALGDRTLGLKAAVRAPFPAGVRARIEALVHPGDDELARCAALDIELGRLFAAAANAVREKGGLDPSAIRAIGSHGQTLRHHPDGPCPYTLQIADPSVIAELTGITVVADFRARDLAAGGQGAPLVPAFHDWLFRKPGRHRVIVNIGGLANLTYLPPDHERPVTGFDTGPGNTLLDRWTERHQGVNFDRDGGWAATGQHSAALLDALLSDPYFSRPPPKSSGRDYFNLAWLDRWFEASRSRPAPADVQATLAELTAQTIASGIRQRLPQAEEVFVCGGGAHNRDLMQRLARALPGIPLATTDALGLAPDWVEAAAFAWLARETLDGRAGNLPAVTGARRAVILGGIYKA